MFVLLEVVELSFVRFVYADPSISASKGTTHASIFGVSWSAERGTLGQNIRDRMSGCIGVYGGQLTRLGLACTASTHPDLVVYVPVDSLGVGDILQHDVADLQRRLAESQLEKLDRPYLHVS